MSRVLLFVLGVLLLCAAALAALWLAGQVLAVLGALLTGAAGVLGRLLIFLPLAALSGGLSYFVASAWRPGQPLDSQAAASQPVSFLSEPVPTARGPRWRRSKRTAVNLPDTAPTEHADSTVVIAATPQVTTTLDGADLPSSEESTDTSDATAEPPRPPS